MAFEIKPPEVPKIKLDGPPTVPETPVVTEPQQPPVEQTTYFSERSEWWQNKRKEFAAQDYVPAEPEKKKKKPVTIFSAVGDIIDMAQDFFGAEDQTEEQVEEAKKFANQRADNIAKATWFVNFYDRIPVLAAAGRISSVEDYTNLFGYSGSPLTDDERDELYRAIQEASNRDPDIPDWLEVESDKERQVRQFFETPRTEVAPESIGKLTVDAIIRSLTPPEASLPEGMTDEELLRFLSVMNLPEDTVNAAIDIDQAIKVFSAADLEQRQAIADVKAGIAEWEAPSMSTWDKLFFAVQSPMQAFADFLEPYMANVAQPLAGWASLTVASLLPGTQGIEEEFHNAYVNGDNVWKAAGTAFEEWDLDWYYKLPIEIAADPLTWVPGVGLSVPARVLNRVGLKTMGSGLMAINKGLWAVTDIPFDAAKHFFSNVSFKTTDQLVRKSLTEFEGTFNVAVHQVTGKAIHQMTVEDVATTLQAAVKQFVETPNLDGNVVVDLGRYLSDHVNLTDKQIYLWSRKYGGALTEDMDAAVVAEVNDIITDFVMKNGSLKANAKRMARSLEIEENPANIAKISKDLPAYSKKLSTNVDNAIQIGRQSRTNGIASMLEYLSNRQKVVLTSKLTGKSASGKTLEGIALGMQRRIDQLEHARWRVAFDRYLVKPFAEANLASISYPLWNAFEGLGVSFIEGVTPKFVKWEAYSMMTKGLIGDTNLAKQSASDVAGIFGSAPSHRAGAFSLLPGKVPEQLFGKETPKWIAGKDWFEWTGRKWVQMSDVWGNAIRRNYVTQKMAQHMAEFAYSQEHGDVIKSLQRLAKGSPKLSKESLGLSQKELEAEMWRRLLSSTEDVLDLKRVLTNGSLMQDEVVKLVRKADMLSPRARAVADEWIAEGKVLDLGVGTGVTDPAVSINKFVDELTGATIEDLKQYPVDVRDSFRHIADTIEGTNVASANDIMELFTHYEVMSETAAYLPHRLMSGIMEDTDVLYKSHNYGKVKDVWTKGREDMLATMDEVTLSLERVRAKIMANSNLLTDKQKNAMLGVLERSEASVAVRDATLKADQQLLDDFWALPRSQRTPKEHVALRTYRNDLWATYRREVAIPSAGEFVMRRKLAELYHDLPRMEGKAVDATRRSLSTYDVAQVFGTNIDGITSGLMQNLALHGREYFIQLVKQTADDSPRLYKGFTEEKIGQVYERIVAQAKMNPEQDLLRQQIIQQGEGLKQSLASLNMRKSLSREEEVALHNWINEAAEQRQWIIGHDSGISNEGWSNLRQQALDAANKDYYKAFADYSNEHMLSAVMKMIYPYWNYHQYRWFALARFAIRHPGLPATWGKYQDYSENGFIPTWFPNLEMNPFVGSMVGATFTLTRFDYSSYYQQLGSLGEVLDYSMRWGYYPNAPISGMLSVLPAFAGRKAELGGVLPPIARTGIDLFVASDIPGVSSAAKWLKDNIFHENFADYYTATILDSMQVKAGGNLIGGQTGTDLWFKKMRGENLTDEEQSLWDEAYEQAAEIGVLRSQFPQFRLRTDDYKEAYDKVTKIIEEQLGMSEEFQRDLWRHHQRPTDVVGGLPLNVTTALDELWEWKTYFGRGAILVPPEVGELKSLMDKYWKKIEMYQTDRLAAQADADTGFINPTDELHFSGAEWRDQYALNWSDYTSKSEKLEEDPEYADAVAAMTPEGELKLAKRLGYAIAPETPLKEAVNLYFDLKLEQKRDPYTGDLEYDFLTFWIKREAVRMALTEEQRGEFDAYVKRYATPMELTFKNAYNRYIRGYKAATRLVFDGRNEQEQVLIKEYYADDTTLSRKEEIRGTEGSDGRLVISSYESALSEARSNLREVSPNLDFWLYVFGYITKPVTKEARAMIDRWEVDRSSILIAK